MPPWILLSFLERLAVPFAKWRMEPPQYRRYCRLLGAKHKTCRFRVAGLLKFVELRRDPRRRSQQRALQHRLVSEILVVS